jgi:hypothetical protein
LLKNLVEKTEKANMTLAMKNDIHRSQALEKKVDERRIVKLEDELSTLKQNQE